jgi:hypothetical protein
MRCLACDAIMKPEEIIWRDEKHSHEDLCRVCRKSVQDSLLVSDLAGPSTYLSYVEEEFEYIEDDDQTE